MSNTPPPKKMPALLQSRWCVRRSFDGEGWEIYPVYQTSLGEPSAIVTTDDAHRPPKWVAELIADAGNTYNATTLTPSQLVEQREELLSMLKGVLMMGRGPSGRIIVEGWQEEVLRTAIAKCGPQCIAQTRSDTASSQ
jgi:hypothetical protein